MYEKLLDRVGHIIVRYRLWIGVILFWIVVAVFMALNAPSLTKVGVMDESMFLPSTSDYLQAKEILKEKFPDQVAAGEGILVFYNPDGLTDADFDYARAIAQWLMSDAAPDNVNQVTSIFDHPELKNVLVSEDGQAMLMPVTFTTADYDPRTNEAVATIRQHIHDTAPKHLQVHLTGPAGMGRDMFKVTLESVDKTTIATVILVILVLLLVYRSPIAALVPLISIASAYLVTKGILGYAAQAGARLSSMLDAMLVVLIFGVGTDYALFLISRFREEVGKSQNRSEAMIRSVAKIGPVITASAATVIIGLLGMMVADFGMTRTNGPAESLGIFITLIAALSLTPALLQLFGEHLFWPFHRQLAKQRIGEGLINWKKIGQFVTDHPLMVSIAVIILLLLPYPAWMNMKSAFNILSEIPAEMDSAQGFRVIQDHFSAGEFAPVTVILVSDQDDLLSPSALRDVAEISESLASVQGVDKVRSIVQPTGDTSKSEFVRVDGQLRMLADQLAEMQSAMEHPEQLKAMMGENKAPQGAFTLLRDYLQELGKAFPEVQQDPAYTEALEVVDTLEARMTKMLDQARVDSQLTAMADRVEAMAKQLADPKAMIQQQPEADGGAAFGMLRAYLDELAAAYPEVKDAPEYQDALSTIDALQKGMARMQAQMRVVNQLKNMAGQMAQMEQALTNPQAMAQSPQQGKSSAQGLQMLAEYLRGLAQAYPDVQKEAAYQDAMARLKSLQQAMTAMQQQASVANQLSTLITQLQGLQQMLSNPQALAQAGQQGQNPAQGVDVIAAYLTELGDAYPQVKQMPQYKDALQRVDALKAAFAQMAQAQAAGVTVPPAQQQAALQAMQENVDGLIQDLEAMQQGFAQHPEAVLFPKSIPAPPEMAQALQQVQADVRTLQRDLNALAQSFENKAPNATYVPKGMMDRPEVQQALQQTQARVQTLAQDLRGLAQRFQGKDAYFFPQHVAQAEGAQVLAEVQADVKRLRTDLETLADQFREQKAYFIPETFLKEMPQLQDLVQMFLSKDETATQLTVLLTGDPYSMETASTIDRLHSALSQTVERLNANSGRTYRGYLGGVPVMSHDLKRTVDRDFGKVQLVVIAGVFLVLVILLRSLIAPIYLVLTVLLSYGTTMGLTTFIFQDLKGYEGVNYILPIMIFVLLVALGADYNIFLMSRVQEESEKAGSVKEGVRLASAYTGGIITSCGIILAGTFAALAVSPLRMLIQMGVAVAIGVLVDTFIVRTLLVPSIATLLGRWNWWPRKS